MNKAHRKKTEIPCIALVNPYTLIIIILMIILTFVEPIKNTLLILLRPQDYCHPWLWWAHVDGRVLVLCAWSGRGLGFTALGLQVLQPTSTKPYLI